MDTIAFSGVISLILTPLKYALGSLVKRNIRNLIGSFIRRMNSIVFAPIANNSCIEQDQALMATIVRGIPSLFSCYTIYPVQGTRNFGYVVFLPSHSG